MKNILVLFTVLILSISNNIEVKGQHIILESTFGSQSYGGTAQKSNSANIKLGYEFENNCSIDLSIIGSHATYDIRMPNITVSNPSLGGLFLNLLTGTNTTKVEVKEVYKTYSRKMTSYNLAFGASLSDRIKVFAGPTMRRNTIITKSSSQITYLGSPFSDLEFDDYTNFGSVIGLDLIQPLSPWCYMLLDLQIMNDHYSTSEKIRDSKFIDSSFMWGLGIGFKIGNHSKKPISEIKK